MIKLDKIKYHQNGIDPSEYGEDHMLTNNWNPNKDYGNEYSNVYFRINAKGYQYPAFHFEPDDEKAFYKEVREALEPLGWTWESETYDGNWHCDYIKNGKSTLYLHPQNFSGEVKKNMIGEIAEALSHGTTFQIEWVDLYDTVYDISDEEYGKYLDTRRDEMKAKMFEIAHTKRTNQYYQKLDIARSIAKKFKLRRLGLDDARTTYVGQTVDYAMELIREMIELKYLVEIEMNGCDYCRSVNKTEQKKLKLANLVV